MVFEGTPLGIPLESHGLLRAGQGLAQVLTMKSFNLQGFELLNNSKILTIMVRSASLGQWPPVDFQQRHLEITRISNGF